MMRKLHFGDPFHEYLVAERGVRDPDVDSGHFDRISEHEARLAIERYARSDFSAMHRLRSFWADALVGSSFDTCRRTDDEILADLMRQVDGFGRLEV